MVVHDGALFAAEMVMVKLALLVVPPLLSSAWITILSLATDAVLIVNVLLEMEQIEVDSQPV